MLALLVRTALRHPALVACLGAALLLVGTGALWQARYDVFPEFVPAQVVVQTEAPGLGAEQVERSVTQPLEDALGGAPQVAALRSESSEGLSVLTLVFEDGVDPFRARQLLAERLGAAAAVLPAGVQAPTLGAMTSSTMDLLKIGCTSTRLSPMALRSLVERVLRPRLLGVPGVARVLVFGGAVRELAVAVQPERLAAADLGLDEVVNATRAALGQRGTGFVDSAGQRVLLQADGSADTPERLALAVLRTPAGGARALTLGDVARIREAAAPAFGDALIQGQPGVLVTASSQYGANTLEVTHRVEAALADLRPLLQREGVQVYPALHRPASFIDTALRHMRDALLLGAGLVAALLLLFLRDWRSALVSFLTIPLSLLLAVLVMQRLGWTLNTMTLGGLAVALGVVVDDAIIDVENILRRLRQARGRGAGAAGSAAAVILSASMEVRRPVLLATLVVALVFVPILFLPGLQGAFFAPLAGAFLLAVFASLALALTLVPALCLLLLRDAPPRREARWLRRAKRLQHRLLRRSARHARWLLPLSLLLGLIGAAGLAAFEGELMPSFREGHFVLQITDAPGTSLAEMMRLGARLSERVRAVPGVATVSLQAGRASNGEDTWGPERGELHVELDPGLSGAREQAIGNALRAQLRAFPALQSAVLTFLGDRISESISGETAPVAVNLYGSDLDALDQWAGRLAALLRRLPGARDVRWSQGAAQPTLRVSLDAAALAAHGLRAQDVLDTLAAAGSGSLAGVVYAGSQAVGVRVGLDGGAQAPPERFAALPLRAADGHRLALGDVARVELSESRGLISHDGGRRRQVVTVAPASADVERFVAAARTAIAHELALPAGMYVEITGAAAEAAAARADLLRHSVLAALGIVALLVLGFADTRSAALVLLNAPFALVGGVLALALTGSALSMGALVGFVTLFGISARNAIMLLSHYEVLVREEGARWNLATALRGARERLTPILMTAVVTALGVLPLAWGNGEAGREVEGPMAVVILGGLVSSTALNLWLLPLLALRHLRWPQRPRAARLTPR